MIHSEILGTSFWLDASSRMLMSAPTFQDGTPDFENKMYVMDWESSHELDTDQFQELIKIIHRLYLRWGHFAK